MLLDAGVIKHKCATIAEAEMLGSIGHAGRPHRVSARRPERRPVGSPHPQIPQHQLLHAHRPPRRGACRCLWLECGQCEGRRRARFGCGAAPDRYSGRRRCSGAVRTGGALCPDSCPTASRFTTATTTSPTAAERRTRGARIPLAGTGNLARKAEAKGVPVPRLVCGGTPSFPVYAGMTDVPGIECSPGTFVLHDAGYGPKYADLAGITPAAVLVTRVVSRPTANRVTLDLGSKAVAADPILEKRVTLLDFPEYKTVGHNEEHLIVETAGAGAYKPGDVVFALPGHICPTVALHKGSTGRRRWEDCWQVDCRFARPRVECVKQKSRGGIPPRLATFPLRQSATLTKFRACALARLPSDVII